MTPGVYVVAAPTCRPPAHCIKFGYVVVKYVWAASRVQSLVSLAAYLRQIDPHRRGRRPPSFLRNRRPPAKFGQKKREKFPHDIRENELVDYELV